LFFVDDLSYLNLLDIAKGLLRQQWNHFLALDMARSSHPGFQELRQFLKNKDKRLKLSGYEDIDHYDLGKLLTLEDFSQRDSLVINTAIPTLNFRKAPVLQKITDDRGRLRLKPHIRHLLLPEAVHARQDYALAWCVSGEGSTWRFRPDIGDSWDKGPRAEDIAKQSFIPLPAGGTLHLFTLLCIRLLLIACCHTSCQQHQYQYRRNVNSFGQGPGIKNGKVLRSLTAHQTRCFREEPGIGA
jgi:hypothetical protein